MDALHAAIGNHRQLHPIRTVSDDDSGLSGTEDPAHTRAIDSGTMDLFRSWGTDAKLVWLGDRGIVGNGHFFFLEDNSDEILDLVVGLVDEHLGQAD